MHAARVNFSNQFAKMSRRGESHSWVAHSIWLEGGSFLTNSSRRMELQRYSGLFIDVMTCVRFVTANPNSTMDSNLSNLTGGRARTLSIMDFRTNSGRPKRIFSIFIMFTRLLGFWLCNRNSTDLSASPRRHFRSLPMFSSAVYWPA